MTDGSILHTPYVTTFFVLALSTAVCRWQMAERSVHEVYDDIVRISIRSSWVTKSDVTVARMRLESMTRKANELESKVRVAQADIGDLAFSRSRWIITLASVMVFGLFGWWILVLLGALVVRVQDGLAGVVVATIGVVAALIVGAVAIAWNGRPGARETGEAA
jgi:hypothetical protein